jgi:hypothetical protein
MVSGGIVWRKEPAELCVLTSSDPCSAGGGSAFGGLSKQGKVTAQEESRVPRATTEQSAAPGTVGDLGTVGGSSHSSRASRCSRL